MPTVGGSMDDGVTAGIPAIQQSDINDGDILGATSSENAGGDLMKYTMILPSGRKLETSPFQVEHKRKMMIQWCDAVRQAIVDDATAKYDESMKAQRKKQMEEMTLDIPAETNPYVVPAAHAEAPPPVHAGKGHDRMDASDPVAMARAQLVRAHCDADHFANVELDAGNKKAAAMTAAAKWTRVLEVLNAS